MEGSVGGILQSLWKMGCRHDNSGLESRLGQDILVFSKRFRPALGPTQTPTQWAPGLKRPGPEVGHSPPSCAELQVTGSVHTLPLYGFMARAMTALPLMGYYVKC